MWSVGRFDLGLSEKEFWGLSVVELVALLERKECEDDAAYFRVGIISSTLANVFRGKGGRRYKPRDFMPSPARGRKQRKHSHSQSPDEMLAAVKGIMDIRDEDIKRSA